MMADDRFAGEIAGIHDPAGDPAAAGRLARALPGAAVVAAGPLRIAT